MISKKPFFSVLMYFLTSMFFIPAFAFAQGTTPEHPTEIVATGIGIDPTGSLKNALTNAIEQAVGLVVDAETMIKNESIVKDQILTYSDGYVEKYDKIKEGKRDDGLYETKIKATVKKRQLVEKLKQSNVYVKPVDGQSLFAEVYTKQITKKDVVPMIEKAFEGLPLGLMSIEVIEQKPAIIEQKPDSIKARWKFKVSINQKKFYEEIAPKLATILGDIADYKSESTIITQGSTETASQIPYSIEYTNDFDSSYLTEIASKKIKESYNLSFFYINVRKNQKNDNMEWKYFAFQDKEKIKNVINKLDNHFVKLPKIRVEFLTAANKTIRQNEIIIKEAEFTSQNRIVTNLLYTSIFNAFNNYSGCYVFPFFVGKGNQIIQPACFGYTFDFTLNEIKDITQIKATLIENND